MNDFIFGIFRVTDAPDKSTQSLEQRYIALVPASESTASSWYTSDTLFGLQEKLKDVVKLNNWQEAERQLLSVGYYKLPYPKQTLNEDDQRFMAAARNDAWMSS